MRTRLSPVGYVRIRQDHVMLVLIVALIGLSVIFALGVERGKELSKAELINPSSKLSLLSPTSLPPAAAPSSARRDAALPPAKLPTTTPKPAEQKTPTPKKIEPVPALEPKPAKPSVPKSPQFAIQVVSYRQPELAQRELARLKQHGEPVFLLKGEGKAALLVGPFSDKESATQKLADLRALYQDCFVRHL
ncbi:MAG: SPOR domain-containing protein [Candidatus Omnitrophica bacterium]|nr:SPOR domain-containing protein [Candidatus Omnitrophota bacterium]